METYRSIISAIFQIILVSGVLFLIVYLLMFFGEFSKKIKKAFIDLEKEKEKTHKALNEIEKLKQSIKKMSPEIYENYWNKYKNLK
jgi:hypothetical protein